MSFPEQETITTWRATWTGQFVKLKAEAPQKWARFAQAIGRVITINYNGRALVDFGDGGWYDIEEFQRWLEIVTEASEIQNYKKDVNSAQPFPGRQS